MNGIGVLLSTRWLIGNGRHAHRTNGPVFTLSRRPRGTSAPKSAPSRPSPSGQKRSGLTLATRRVGRRRLTNWSFEQLAGIAGAPPKPRTARRDRLGCDQLRAAPSTS